MGLVTFLIVGLIAGYAANALHGRRERLAQNLVTGVAGALLGGVLFWVLGLRATGFVGALVIATVGAVVLLFLLDRFGRPGR
ncbi:MAG: GlsB/YeaQ/YmgE family stress response membrane protein [Amaricoccus sp.]|nr:GlsB/YeaQ/YmgE family stress response membrane protein [Amaricoccus sp.]